MDKKERKGIILVGDGEELTDFCATMSHRDEVLGVFCSQEARVASGLTRLGAVSEAPAFMEAHAELKAVYCSVSRIAVDELEAVRQRCKIRAVSFHAVVPAVGRMQVEWVPRRVGDKYVLSPRREPLSRLYNRVLKRLFDWILVVVFMLTFFPLVYLYKLVRIKCKERKPSVVFSDCVGPDGRAFRRVSFRGEGTSLAQVLNVFVGQMSLVGPSCHAAGVQEGEPTLRVERKGVKSGMTGWAQLKGGSGAQQLDADVWYLEHWSVWLDLKIIFMSLFSRRQ